MITGKTIPYGLFGYPVRHTFSPQMHNYVFNELNIDGVYLPFEVKPEYLKMSLKSLVWLGFKGINITVPHKQTCMEFLDDIDEEAELIGAVNTIKVKKEKLIGYNTDGIGFINSLQKNNIDLKGSKILVLGAGGASRAISVSMVRNNNLNKIYIYDIDFSKSKSLIEKLNSIRSDIALGIEESDLENLTKEIDILINATPVGLRKEDIPINPDFIKPNLKLVYDLIYNPPKTNLLKEAQDKGIFVINGLNMLVNQAAVSFKIWTGKDAPVDIMRESMQVK